MTTIARPASDVATLRRLLDGEHAEMRDRVREWLSRPGNIPTADRALDEYRDQVLAWAKELADDGQTATGFPVEYGGEGAVGRSIAAFETMAFGDLSLLVKIGVQFGLSVCGAAINASKVALVIAIRRGLTRRQF